MNEAQKEKEIKAKAGSKHSGQRVNISSSASKLNSKDNFSKFLTVTDVKELIEEATVPILRTMPRMETELKQQRLKLQDFQVLHKTAV